MPKAFPALVAVALLVAFSGPALAIPPISTNLSWDHCAGEGRISDRSFACDDTTGFEDFFVSLVLHDSTRTNIAGLDCTIDITPVAPVLPDWWKTATGQCHQNALSLQFGIAEPGPACTPWYQDVALGVSILSLHYPSPDRLVLHLDAAVSYTPWPPALVTLERDREYALFQVRLFHRKSSGPGYCAGCAVPTCIGVGKLNLGRYDSQYNERFAGADENTITWQGAYVAGYSTVPDANGGAAISDFANLLDCTLAPVPARNRTWGMIKTLYR